MSVIMMNSLLGSGDVGIVLKTNLCFQWLVFFPTAIILVLLFDPGFLLIWLVFILSRLGQGLVYLYHWHHNQWGQARL